MRNFDHIQNENSVTMKTNIIDNFLRFPTHLCTPQADNRSNGYGYPKTVARHKVQREAGN
jgi:hypothetical protein